MSDNWSAPAIRPTSARWSYDTCRHDTFISTPMISISLKLLTNESSLFRSPRLTTETSSVFCCCGPVDLEFADRQSSWLSCGSQPVTCYISLVSTFSGVTWKLALCETLTRRRPTQRIINFCENVLHKLNSHFTSLTYLLTYLFYYVSFSCFMGRRNDFCTTTRIQKKLKITRDSAEKWFSRRCAVYERL